MGSQDHPVGQLFWGFKSSRPQAPAWRHIQIWALKMEFPEIALNHDCGGLMVSSGSLEHNDSLFLKSDKNYGVMAPKAKRENMHG